MASIALALTPLAEDVWIVERPLSFLGIEMGTRMTVVRTEGDALWICSPVELTDGLQRAIDDLGAVRWVVAPNRFHHLFVGPFMEAYPDAKLFGCPGLEKKRADLQFDDLLSRTPDDWAGAIDCVRAEGIPMFDELLFHHRASRTLIATDILVNGTEDSARVFRWLSMVDGAYQQLAVPRSTRYLLVRDRKRLRASMEEALSWPFDRVVLAHGAIVARGAKPLVDRAFSWLMRG